MIIEDFLAKLGASTKITVGVSVSPAIGLEMIEVDRLTGTINKYAHRPLEYNHSTREIADYKQFQTALEKLFDDLKIPKKSNVVLSIPSVHFGMVNLPLLLTDEAITNAIISEVEQSYIFKRQEPVISWTEVYSNIDTENRVLVYSAIQESALSEIKDVCAEIGCTLAGVENSYASLIKALHYTGLTEEQMKEGTTWNLMIIGQNSYSILSMVDKKIMEYYEEPLALKSFVDNEIYNAITTSAQLTLAGLSANYLTIVSETDLVSAEVLSMKIQVESTIKFIECNKYTQTELLPSNLNILTKMALQVTLEAVGAAIYPHSSFPLKLNLIQDKDSDLASSLDASGYPKVTIGNLEIELTPNFLKRVALILGGIIILPMIFLSFEMTNMILPKEHSKLDDINTRMEQTKGSIEKYSNAHKENAFDVKLTTNKILTQNKTKLTYYSALGISIPRKLWVTYYTTNENGQIDIKGQSATVDGVYTFYKNLKQLVNNSDIRLYKLEMSSASLDDVISDVSSSTKNYSFEITNMTDVELNPPAAGAAGANGAPGAPGAPGSPNAQPGSAQPGQDKGKSPFSAPNPLFGANNNNNSPASPAAPSPTPNTPPMGGDQLPKNLQKIDKF